jgi:hypothetical protein
MRVSLVAHPERNVLITGPADSPYADVTRALALRLGRRVCDVQVESRKRKLLALSAVFSGHKDEASLYKDVLRDCAERRNQVACLDLSSLVATSIHELLLSRFYVVLLLGESEGGPMQSDNGLPGIPGDALPFDLQLNCGGLHVRQLARIITHCLYG